MKICCCPSTLLNLKKANSLENVITFFKNIFFTVITRNQHSAKKKEQKTIIVIICF